MDFQISSLDGSNLLTVILDQREDRQSRQSARLMMESQLMFHQLYGFTVRLYQRYPGWNLHERTRPH